MDEKKAMCRFVIEGELSIFSAAAERERLIEALGNADEIEVDLSKVTEIDSAGLQLMVAAKLEAAKRSMPLRFVGHSAAVLEILDLCDLAGHFGDPVVIHSQP